MVIFFRILTLLLIGLVLSSASKIPDSIVFSLQSYWP